MLSNDLQGVYERVFPYLLGDLVHVGVLMAKTTNFVNFRLAGQLMRSSGRIIKLSGVGSCCSSSLGCTQLGRYNVSPSTIT